MSPRQDDARDREDNMFFGNRRDNLAHVRGSSYGQRGDRASIRDRK